VEYGRPKSISKPTSEPATKKTSKNEGVQIVETVRVQDWAPPWSLIHASLR